MSPRPHDTLNEQTGFLRRLARSLLYDRASADDAVQEAWLVALRKDPRDPLSMRSWLAGVVRNVARQSVRDAGRRTRREEGAAEPERTGSAADAAQRLEQMRRVADAVESLEEPYRETVLLRYFDGLAPRDIARVHGVPVETVRTRLKRALARLRVTLDEDRRDSREALLGALVPWAGRAPLDAVLAAGCSSGAAALSASAGGVGAVVMGKTGAAVVAVVVLGVAGWFWRGAGEPETAETGDPGPRDRVQAPAADDVVEHRADPTRELAAAEPAGAAGAPTWRVSGRAFLSDRTVAADAAVLLTITPADGHAPLETVLRTDVAGRFAWSGEVSHGGGRVGLGAGEEGFFSYGQQVWVPPGRTVADDLAVYLHPIDARLRGVVLDESRRPLEGAEVWSLYGRTRSDAAGRFDVPGASVASRNHVSARADGYAQVRVTADPPGPGPFDGIEVVLRRSFRVVGRVTGADGAPLEGATVSTIFAAGTEARTDPEGRYTIEHLDPGRPRWHVTVAADGHRTAETWVDTRGTADVTHDVKLRIGATVRGRVVDEEGAPVAGAELFLGAFLGAVDGVGVTSGGDGSFALAHAPTGTLELSGRRAGFAPGGRSIDVPESGELDDVQLRLGRAHALAGVVLDAAGRPVDAALVQALIDHDVAAPNARTDERGRFRLVDVPARTTHVRVLARGHVRLVEEVRRLDVDDARFVVTPEGRLGGRVVDGVSGAPIPSFTIRLVPAALAPGESGARLEASWSREGHLFRSEGGEWSADGLGLAAGTIVGVEATAPGYASATADRVPAVGPDDPLELVLPLERGARIVGQVVARGTGAPVEGVMVKAYARDEVVWEYDDDGVHGRRMARTDAHGLFILEAVPPGPTRLRLKTADGLLVSDGPFDVPRAGAVERRIEVRTPGVLTGTVLDAAGRPVAGARVVVIEMAERGEASRDHRASTNGEGRFRVEGLPGARYAVLHIESVGGVRATRLGALARLEDGGTADVMLRPRGRARIEGTIAGADGAVAAAYAIEARRKDALASGDPLAVLEAMRGAVAVDGRFVLDGLRPGAWTVIVRTETGLAGSVDVEVSVGEPAEVTVTLDRP